MEKIQKTFVILVCSWMLVGKNSGKRVIPDVRQTQGYTTFRVYAHEFFAGAEATLYEIARADITVNSPTQFGLMQVADDLVTTGPEPTEADKLGRVQGYVINTGLTDADIMLHVNFVFTAGPYQGSVLTIAGHKNSSITAEQEVPITGGVGFFRSARGYSVAQTLSYDPVANYVLFVYDFYIETGLRADQETYPA